MRILAENTSCIVIDYQEKILPAMSGREELVANSAALLKGLNLLEIPMVLTTQYAKGLGNNIPEICEAIGSDVAYDKTTFSAYETEAVYEAMDKERKNVLICGIEAHICVLQTAIDLKAAGYQPVIVADCVSSRKELNKELGLKRAEQEGILITSKEAILFELTRKAGGPVFKQISALIK